MSFELLATAAKLALWVAVLLNVTPIMVWIERRGSALIQDRLGPNRVGPLGLFQSLADAVKFICKEDVVPTNVDKTLYFLAPMLALVPALTTFVVIPFGPEVEVAGRQVKLLVADVDTGVLLLLALASLGVYSLVIAGYSSNNKYSLLGSVRASAQMISYELALTLSVVAVLVPAGSLRLDEVVAYQQGTWLGFLPGWNVFPQFLGFVVFLVASFAETNRLPFDLPEAESELVAGYHTEYSSMKFALFFMGEYMSMATLSALGATLFFGGWHLPGLSYTGPWPLVAATGLGVLLGKVTLFLLFFVWVRWSFPRFRFDQLMQLGWKVLLPLAVVNLIATAAMTLAGWL
ncbi:MAG: NADH-quinone oxidoreductase subunit NuoH [Thermoanaerobaculia bacterium]|nr:NADH-quinone oxidoreductase subunit NuoH [Thermoanaerobaculia bacterium]